MDVWTIIVLRRLFEGKSPCPRIEWSDLPCKPTNLKEMWMISMCSIHFFFQELLKYTILDSL